VLRSLEALRYRQTDWRRAPGCAIVELEYQVSGNRAALGKARCLGFQDAKPRRQGLCKSLLLGQ